MKTIKKILLGILLLIILILLVAAFAAKNYNVEKQILIKKPLATVFEYVKSLKNQDLWSVWGSLDPNMKKEFVGTDGTVGFISRWAGNKAVGKGEQEITGIEPGRRVDLELRFIEPWEAVSPAYIITEAVSATTTRVRWGFSGHMSWPMNFMLLFMNMDKAIGKDFETGLSNLKALLEA